METSNLSNDMNTTNTNQLPIMDANNPNESLSAVEALSSPHRNSQDLSVTENIGMASQHLNPTSPAAQYRVSTDNASHLVSLALSQLQANTGKHAVLQKITEEFSKGSSDTTFPAALHLESFQRADTQPLSDGAVIDVCVSEKSVNSYPQAEIPTSMQPLINPNDINAVVKYLASEMHTGHSSTDFNYQVPETIAKTVHSVSNLHSYGDGQTIELVQEDMQSVQNSEAVLYSVPTNHNLEQTLAENFTGYPRTANKLRSTLTSTTASAATVTADPLHHSNANTSVPSNTIITLVPKSATSQSTEIAAQNTPNSLVYHSVEQPVDMSINFPMKDHPYDLNASSKDIEQSQVLSVNLNQQPLVHPVAQPVVSLTQPLEVAPTHLLTHTDPTQLVPAQENVLATYSMVQPADGTQLGTIPVQTAAHMTSDQETSVVKLLVGAPEPADQTTHDVTTTGSIAPIQCEVIRVMTERELVEMSNIYCVECNASYKTSCTLHDTTYSHVYDKPVLTRARSTLPDDLYFVKVDKDNTPSHQLPILGVYAQKKIEAKTSFGPLVGQVCSTSEKPQTRDSMLVTDEWTVFQSDEPALTINTASEDASNWLKFVRRAKTSDDQNLVVFQRGLSLYFITTRDVAPEEELCYWYSKDYATKLNVAHIPQGIRKCDECTSQFPDDAALRRHKKHQHPSNTAVERKFLCPTCHKGFSSRTKVELHMTKHTGARPIKCPVCAKGFTDKSNMKKHMKIHEGVKEHVCTVCGKGFRQRIHLETHLVIHDKKKPLSCSYCDRKFARTADLRQHENIHTKAQEFPCPVCQRVFHRKNNMIKHIEIHNPKRKRHPCTKCSKDYPNIAHMRRHLKSCKGKKKPPLMKIRSETGAELGLSIAKKRIQKRDLMLQRQNSALSHSSTVG